MQFKLRQTQFAQDKLETSAFGMVTRSHKQLSNTNSGSYTYSKRLVVQILKVIWGQSAEHCRIYLKIGAYSKCLVVKMLKVIQRSFGVEVLNIVGFT